MTATRHVVTNIDYDAKGQRVLIVYGNGVDTAYTYDQKAFRLTQIRTASSPGAPLQSLTYTYDPVGNVCDIHDDAQETFFFNGQMVAPSNSYEYDALYRLITATGREHIGQNSTPQVDNDDAPRINLPLPTDTAAMRNYAEAFEYDSVDNILAFHHMAGPTASWTRNYYYELTSNRLLGTSLPGDPANVFSARYPYDLHGNMLGMPHLSLLRWDFKDQLQASSRQVVSSGISLTTWNIYDSSGQRVRKVSNRSMQDPGKVVPLKSRVYLGSLELYREYATDGTTIAVEIETLHVMDDMSRIALIETETINLKSRSSASRPLVRYQFSNHLGSASLELDDNSKIISYEEYHPYGTTSFQEVNKNIRATAKRYRYTGKERDDENALAYHGARYLVPWLGRWLNCDPAGLADSSNPFVYVSNCPTRFRDNNGKWETDMHFVMPYWTGRLQGADHDLALRVALASQLPDDFSDTVAPTRKITGHEIKELRPGLSVSISGVGELSLGDWLVRTANNMHALAVDYRESERVAQTGIQKQNEYLFGLGLHPVGDFLPHASLPEDNPIKITAGHHVGKTETGDSSHFLSTNADKTHLNPRNALDTIAHFSKLWDTFLGNQGGPVRIGIPKDQARLMRAFVLADTDDEKRRILGQTGIAGMDKVIDLMDKEKRLAALKDSNIVDANRFAQGIDDAIAGWSQHENDAFWNYSPVDLSSVPDTWGKMGLGYPAVVP